MNTERDFVAMLVDDDPDEHFFIGVALSSVQRKVAILNFFTVPDALQKLQSMPQLPDLIILDIYLPSKDGLAMLNDLKSNDRLKDIPVMMYSGIFSDDTIEKATKKGVTLFLQKTPNIKKLTASLEEKIEALSVV